MRRSPVALRPCLRGLGWVPGSPLCLRMLCPSPCPPGRGFLPFPGILHALLPTRWLAQGSCLSEGVMKQRSLTRQKADCTSRLGQPQPSVPWGLKCVCHKAGQPVLHGVTETRPQLCKTVINVYGVFAMGWALCSVLYVGLHHLVLTAILRVRYSSYVPFTDGKAWSG